MKQRIDFTISRQAENFYEESFVVPHDLETLYVKVEVPEECRYMAFVILKDQAGQIRLQKLLGYGEQKLAVGADGMHTAIGGVPGAIHPGKWKLCLGIFTEYVKQRLKEEKILLSVELSDSGEITEPMGAHVWVAPNSLRISGENYSWDKPYQQESRWYKGDFHTHTRLSDGKETVIHAMEKAEDMELDFYVPTEHNLMHTGWCDTSLCILPGIEITTDKGHFNLFGITGMPERLLQIVRHNGTPQLDKDVEMTLKEAREKGWIVSLNHPFLTIWKWQFGQTPLDAFQCVEIVNDPTYPDAPPSNDEAIRFVDALWEDGHRIYGVGGSDSHNLLEERYKGAELPSVAGDPGTYVYCDGLSPVSLLEHVRAGHMCVTRFCQVFPKITVGNQEYLPGEEIKGDPDAEGRLALCYQAEITGFNRTPLVFLVKNGQKIPVEVSANAAGNYQIEETVSLNPEEWNWVRLEIRQQTGEFSGYVNPVYCGRKQPALRTVEEIWKQME